MSDTPTLPSWQTSVAGETSRAFEAFCAFRDAGPTRAITAVYRQRTGKDQAKQASGEWNNWAERFHWRERAEVYDAHVAETARKAAETVRKGAEAEHTAKITAYRERAAKIGAATADVSLGFLIAAGKRLKALTDGKPDTEGINDIPIKSLPSFLRAAAAVAEISLRTEAQALGVEELETYLHDGDKDAAKDSS